DVRGMLREFADTLREELDYRREAGNVAFFRELFAKERGFRLPEVVPEFTTEKILVLTRIEGVKISQAAPANVQRRRATARRLARFVLEPAFARGIFHADPHAGNMLITDEGALAVVDFGMVGRLTP